MYNKKGFTLLELMIVMAIIAMLIAASFFPFSYYMERARVEKNIDTVGQEWIVLHQDVRNGLLEGEHHATLDIEMSVGSGELIVYGYTGASTPKRELKRIPLDRSLEILGFSGSAPSTTHTVTYTITPPFATGSFSLDGSPSVYLSGLLMRIGYPGGAIEGGRARDILLRPYYD